MATDTGSRPYLDESLDPERMETGLNWARYLGTTFGTSGALCALRYYERLGWIGPATRRSVERQLLGLSTEEIHSKKYDDPGSLDGPLAPLSGTPFGAHAKSLEFISTLADDDIETDVFRAKIAKRRAERDETDDQFGWQDDDPPVE